MNVVSESRVDILANLTIGCCAFVIIVVYVSIALSPPWDDGTGFPLFSSHFDHRNGNDYDHHRHQLIKEELIPQSAKRWASNLSIEISATSATPSSYSSSSFDKERFVVDVFDSLAELGKHHVMKLSMCKNETSTEHGIQSFCLCNTKSEKKSQPSLAEDVIKPLLWNQNPGVSIDERVLHEQQRVAPDRRETAIMVRVLAQSQAERIERESFDRLVLRLKHYFQTNAGIDVLFKSIFYHHQVQVEEAPIGVRHSRMIVQPRLPPKRDSSMKLNFIVVEKDSRSWVYDLAKDPQANALTHAPFVFPMFLILLSCLMRVIKGFVMMVFKK